MVALGFGEIIGALISGGIQDKLGNRVMIIYSATMMVVAFSILITYNTVFEYGWLTFFMTFTWGIQDSAANTFISCILGF